MKKSCFIPMMVAVLLSATSKAQDTSAIQQSSKKDKLFNSEEALEISLRGNVKQVLKDRGVESKYFPLQLVYKTNESATVTIPIQIKTRGHFRKMKSNCTYPPLLLNFSDKEKLSSTIFKGQEKLKLVMPCRGDEYVVREWLVYKIYNLVTPLSFQARLVKIKLEDTNDKENAEPFYGMLLEEDKKMAKRNKQVCVTKKMSPEGTFEDVFTTMCVFEYLIGNTDWSVQFMQNIKLIAADTLGLLPTTVPYDFDHAGIVSAPYAQPEEALQLSSVKERRYRGYCIKNMKTFDSSIALFNKHKDEIYNLYKNCLLIDDKYRKTTIKYLDDFYNTINDPSALKKEFSYPCDLNGTGNVIIKGLKED